MKKLLFLFLLFSMMLTLIYGQDMKGYSILKLKSNRDKDSRIIELILTSMRPTKRGLDLTYSNDEISLVLRLNEDDTVDIEMEIRGRPFSGSLHRGMAEVAFFDGDTDACLYFKERFSLGATTMSVPTAYFVEQGSSLYFGTD